MARNLVPAEPISWIFFSCLPGKDLHYSLLHIPPKLYPDFSTLFSLILFPDPLCLYSLSGETSWWEEACGHQLITALLGAQCSMIAPLLKSLQLPLLPLPTPGSFISPKDCVASWDCWCLLWLPTLACTVLAKGLWCSAQCPHLLALPGLTQVY